jgi:hypothetical protein
LISLISVIYLRIHYFLCYFPFFLFNLRWKWIVINKLLINYILLFIFLIIKNWFESHVSKTIILLINERILWNWILKVFIINLWRYNNWWYWRMIILYYLYLTRRSWMWWFIIFLILIFILWRNYFSNHFSLFPYFFLIWIIFLSLGYTLLLSCCFYFNCLFLLI